jgi:hypothetical protein
MCQKTIMPYLEGLSNSKIPIQNTGNPSPNNTAPYPRRLQSVVKAFKNKVSRRVNKLKPIVSAMEQFGIMLGWTNDQLTERFHLLIQTWVNN